MVIGALLATALVVGACGGESSDDDAVDVTAPPGDAPALDLETLEAESELGTLRARRAESSYVALIDNGQAVGITTLDEFVAAEEEDLDDWIVVQLYDRERLALMAGQLDSEGAATLESEAGSDLDASVKVTIEDDAASGTATFAGEREVPFTAEAATGVGGVYGALGADEDPDAGALWVVLSDGREWGGLFADIVGLIVKLAPEVSPVSF